MRKLDWGPLVGLGFVFLPWIVAFLLWGCTTRTETWEFRLMKPTYDAPLTVEEVNRRGR